MADIATVQSIQLPAPRPPATDAEHQLLDFLNAMAVAEVELWTACEDTSRWAHRSVGELLLAHGRWSTPAVLPTTVSPGAEGECYGNAAAVEREHPGARYVEGFAVVAGTSVALGHAWCTDAAGNAIDPTWPELGGGAAYFGIALPAHLRPDLQRRVGVLAQPQTLHTLLQHGLPARPSATP